MNSCTAGNWWAAGGARLVASGQCGSASAAAWVRAPTPAPCPGKPRQRADHFHGAPQRCSTHNHQMSISGNHHAAQESARRSPSSSASTALTTPAAPTTPAHAMATARKPGSRSVTAAIAVVAATAATAATIAAAAIAAATADPSRPLPPRRAHPGSTCRSPLGELCRPCPACFGAPRTDLPGDPLRGRRKCAAAEAAR